MATSSVSLLLLLLQVLAWLGPSLACYCERYPWVTWSPCTKTCNYGTQHRHRISNRDDYYWKNSCYRCEWYDVRACNTHACPISCLLGEFGEWSKCSPCAKKMLRTRFVLRPSQFGGEACSEVLTEERPCHPETECRLPEVNCREKFKCDNGRCINATLTCNHQNECDDNSDERDCHGVYKTICPREIRPPPGADVVAHGFDAMAEDSRAPVLNSRFMGDGICEVKQASSRLLFYRMPHNFVDFEIKVEVTDDFKNQVKEATSSRLVLKDHVAVTSTVFGISKGYKKAFEASRLKRSSLFSVHQDLPVATFKLRDAGDLVLDGQFLKYLSALPLEYNYPLYREIFLNFGTHYHSSGSLGGVFEMIYQYDVETVESTGDQQDTFSQCVLKDNSKYYFFYTKIDRSTRCTNRVITEKYKGSYMNAAQKTHSLVKGGVPRMAALLSLQTGDATPPSHIYRNWTESVILNPLVLDYQLRPVIELVRGIPCAATKRRLLRRALASYLEEFDTCRCSPCPNNALVVLSGTECRCLCRTGTYGPNCEMSAPGAPGYRAEVVDGSWSCWGPWDECGAAMKRRRTRKCDNPAPLRGGQPCEGAGVQVEPCHFSIFQKQVTCDNDDVSMGWRDELPPGVVGCLRPPRPANSYLLKGKLYYEVGEDEEFQCFTGHENNASPFLHCLPDLTWSQPNGRCQRAVCDAPRNIPEDMELYPDKKEYRVGESVAVNCKGVGLKTAPLGIFRCTWEYVLDPPVPDDLHCVDAIPWRPEVRCGPGETRQGSACVCVDRESCMAYQPELCAMNLNLNATVPLSTCSLQAARCHGDPLVFVNMGRCDDSATDLEWVLFRSRMAGYSVSRAACGADICYDWETCDGKRCLCNSPLDCPRNEGPTFCIELGAGKRRKETRLCLLAAMRCSSMEIQVLNEGPCADA